jgi:acyl carrier protein
MEELIAKLAEILEVEVVDVNKKFSDYEEWDSLSALSVLAMLDSDYHIQMKNTDIAGYDNIEAFCKDVLAR